MNDATRRLVLRLKGPLDPQGSVAQDPEERARSLRKATESVLTLPTLPLVASRMLQMVDDPRISAGALGRALSEDQVLTARVLKLANSSYYGFPRAIGTVNLAVVVLGFDAVKELVLSVAVMDLFRHGASDTRLDMPRFWDHSVRVAAAARQVARILRWKAVGEAFTAGILHDIGRVVLHQYQPRQFDEMVRRVVDDGVPPLDAELDVLGATHAEVGAWLVEKWNLPASLVHAVRYHHSPDDAPPEHAALAALLQIADVLTHRLGYGNGLDGHGLPQIHPAALRILAAEGLFLGEDDLGPLEKAILEEVEKVDGLREAFR